jgi:anti-anti-sigma regulatory factor
MLVCELSGESLSDGNIVTLIEWQIINRKAAVDAVLVVFDPAVIHVSSQFLFALVNLQMRLRNTKSSFAICGANSTLHSVLDFAGLTKLFPEFLSQDSAKKAWEQSGEWALSSAQLPAIGEYRGPVGHVPAML